MKSSLSKVQAEKKQLQEKLNDLEKVGCLFVFELFISFQIFLMQTLI